MILGSSNARGINLGSNKSFRITNNCIGGATIRNLYKQFKSTNTQRHLSGKEISKEYDFFVIFQGINGYDTSNWNSFTNDFEIAMEDLEKRGLPKQRTIVIGPLPRGNQTQIWKHQMRSSTNLLNNLEKKGFQTINVFEEIPKDRRTPQKIFGYRDYNEQKYVHYGPYVINTINVLTRMKIIHLTNNTTKGKLN